MKIRILASARQDLIEGRRFYEAQGEGLGDYFRRPAWIRTRLRAEDE